MKGADDALILAAIVFDAPRLRKADDAGAQLFLHVMDLRPVVDDDPRLKQEVNHPLHIAAIGLSRELSGDPGGARAQYEQLLGHTGVAALLGAQLIAWME